MKRRLLVTVVIGIMVVFATIIAVDVTKSDYRSVVTPARLVAAPTSTTSTTVPAPAPSVQVVEVPGPTVVREVTPQACSDFINRWRTDTATLAERWNAWVSTHPTATAEDYYAITTDLHGAVTAAGGELDRLAQQCESTGQR